jgi:hypothetical protein
MGAVRLVTLYVNGSWRRTPLIRAFCAILGMAWWLVLGSCSLRPRKSDPSTAGLMWFPVFIAFEGYSVVRGARDPYHSGALQFVGGTDAIYPCRHDGSHILNAAALMLFRPDDSSGLRPDVARGCNAFGTWRCRHR